MNGFGGRVAVVTGALRGIGRATALSMAEAGATVVVFDLDPPEAPAVKAAIDAVNGPGGLVYARVDVTERSRVDAAAADILDRLGRVDILVNNVGVGRPARPVDGSDPAEWDMVVDRNLTSAYNCARAFAAAMKAQGHGRIVNVSSQAGRSKSEIGNLSYASAKAGMLGFTRQLAQELAPFGITVNAVAPGLTLTDRVKERLAALDPAQVRAMAGAVPIGRFAEPEEIAAVIRFLASDDAGYVTGATIDVNGGRFMM